MRAVCLLLLCLAGGPVAAAEAPDVAPADAAAIRRVIQTQLDAFRHDDPGGAFAEASPGIQHQFGDDPAVFMDMVRRLYQPVYHPRSTQFGRVSVENGQVVQHLQTIGADGGAHEALYYMEHEPDGTWRISGCVLTDGGSVAA